MERPVPPPLPSEAEGINVDKGRESREEGGSDERIIPEFTRRGEGHHNEYNQKPPPQGDVETETVRTALEPTGHYSNVYHNEPISGGVGEGSVNSHNTNDNHNEVHRYAQQQEISKNGLAETKLEASVGDKAQTQDLCTPPWSHSQSQFPLPKNPLLKTPPPIEHSEQHKKPKRRFDSFAELWAQKIAKNTSRLAKSDEVKSSALSNEHNVHINQKLGANDGTATATVTAAATSTRDRVREKIIKNKTREDFFDAIAKDKVVIENDSSVTGRYSSSKIKYQPYGFVPSTEEACKEEIYEVIKPSSTLCYTYYDNDDFQILLHKHYQSWDPKTMQYSPQPYNIFQPLCGNTQYPLTPSTNAAAGTRAALLSFMTKSNSSENMTRYSGANISNLHSENQHFIRDESYNNSNTNMGLSMSRADSTSSEAFGRRHSLAMSGQSFDAMYDFNFPPSSSLQRSTSGNSSMGRLRHFDNTFDDYTFPRPDTSTIDATTEDLFRICGESQLLSNSQSNTVKSGVRKARGSKKRSQHTESPPTSKRRKNKATGRGTPNSAKRKKKKDNSPTRRSSRRRTKRDDFDDDSSAHDISGSDR